MNKVILLGNTTKDIELRYSSDNNAIGRTSLAVKRFGKNDQTDFLNLVSFGKTAESMDKYVKKGTKILVEGSIQTGSYEGKDGKKVYTTDIIVSAWEFAGAKNENSESATPTAKADNDGFMSIPEGLDEELPFA